MPVRTQPNGQDGNSSKNSPTTLEARFAQSQLSRSKSRRDGDHNADGNDSARSRKKSDGAQ
jgi:hypothetical protein